MLPAAELPYGAIIEYQHCVVIIDTSAAIANVAVGDAQAGNGDGFTSAM